MSTEIELEDRDPSSARDSEPLLDDYEHRTERGLGKMPQRSVTLPARFEDDSPAGQSSERPYSRHASRGKSVLPIEAGPSGGRNSYHSILEKVGDSRDPQHPIHGNSIAYGQQSMPTNSHTSKEFRIELVSYEPEVMDTRIQSLDLCDHFKIYRHSNRLVVIFG